MKRDEALSRLLQLKKERTSRTPTELQLHGPWSVWEKEDTALPEFERRAVEINLEKLFENQKIVLLGEDHSDTKIKNFIAKHASILRKIGITHFGIEFAADIQELLDKGDIYQIRTWILNSKIATTRTLIAYANMIEALLKQGIKIIATDVSIETRAKLGVHDKRRDSNMMHAILNAVNADKKNRFISLCGYHHVYRIEDQSDTSNLSGQLGHRGVVHKVVRILGTMGKFDCTLTNHPSAMTFKRMLLRTYTEDTNFMMELSDTMPWSGMRVTCEFSGDALIYLGKK